MNIGINSALAFMCAVAGLSGQANACSTESFGKEKAAVSCFWADCRRNSAPDEVRQIKHGAYAEFVGLSINDGTAYWIGVDLDKSELFEVKRFAGQFLKTAPSFPTTARHFAREEKTEKRHWIDVVRTREIRLDELERVVCAANDLWSGERAPAVLVTDIFNEVRLVDGSVNKGIGGLGGLPEKPREFEKLLKSLLEPDRK